MAMKTKTRKLAVTGMMTAIMIVMGTTPLGFIPIGPFKITIMHLPVIIGAILEGPVVGLVLGLFFGLFSLYQAVTAPTILSPLFMDPLVSVLPRMIIGLTSYYAYAGIERLFRNRNLSPLPLNAQDGRCKRFFKRTANLLRTNTNSLSVGTSALGTRLHLPAARGLLCGAEGHQARRGFRHTAQHRRGQRRARVPDRHRGDHRRGAGREEDQVSP